MVEHTLNLAVISVSQHLDQLGKTYNGEQEHQQQLGHANIDTKQRCLQITQMQHNIIY